MLDFALLCKAFNFFSGYKCAKAGTSLLPILQGNTVSYQYDLNGKVTKMIDKSGNATNYTYNSLGLVSNMNVVLGGVIETLPQNQVSYSYDCLGNRISMTDDSGDYTYAYDSLQRLITVTKDNATIMSYTYTNDDSIASVSYNGVTTNYTYDSCNRLLSVRNGTYGADYTYDSSNNVIKIEYVGGVSEVLTYNKNNAIRSVSNKKADNNSVSAFSYTYDLCGRQISKTDAYGTTTYTYDSAGHILQVNMPGKTSAFTYDAVGNRVSMTENYVSFKTFNTESIDNLQESVVQYNKKVVSYTYSSRNELLLVSEMMYNGENTFVIGKYTNYTYDKNGNQYMSVSGLTYPQTEQTSSMELVDENSTPSGYLSMTQSTFDGFNRLSSIRKTEGVNTTTTAYAYNGDGLRAQKTVTISGGTSKTTNYLYDGKYVVAESGDSTATYVRGLSYIAKIGVSNSVDYYLYNAHGDVTQVVDSTGTIKNQYDYDVFGETILNIEETENSIKYSGEFFDESARLYYLRARFYNPTTGRFISEDSYKGDIKEPSSLNLYTYCHNDPINFIDPTGHSAQSNINSAYNAWKGGYISYKEYADNVRLNGGTPVSNSKSGNKTTSTVTTGSSKSTQSGTLGNLSSLSGKQQGNINSAYNAWKGGYITYEQYSDNVKLNGGTLSTISPANTVAFNVNNLSVNVDNYQMLSAVQKQNVNSGIKAYNQNYIGFSELYSNLQNNGAALSTASVKSIETSDSSYNSTGFNSFDEFFAYSLINPQEAQMILYHLNDTNQKYLGQVVNDYVYNQGGMQKGNKNIYQMIYTALPSWTGADNTRNLHLNSWDEGGLYNSERNMYDNYEFTLFDALNWMIQSGGNGNFALQTRVISGFEDKTTKSAKNIALAASGQRNIVGKFMDATNFMRLANVIGKGDKPQLFIGSTEDDGSNAKDIYQDIIKTDWLKGNEDIIGGIYYGHEDSKDLSKMKEVSDYIHEQHKKMIWIPYIDEDSGRNVRGIIDTYASSGLFDIIIIQPGAFYNNKKYINGIDYINEIVDTISNYDNKNGGTKLGIEMEFDMGVVTGRNRGNVQMTYLDKRRVLIDYLRAFDELKGTDTPIGVYSGGPNEQGYNDIRFNRNTHNSGNHIPYWDGIDESAYAYGVYYDHFADRYVGGNAIYDVNNYLYNGIWNPALTDSLWLDPR